MIDLPSTVEIETLPSETPRHPELLDEDMPAITWEETQIVEEQSEESAKPRDEPQPVINTRGPPRRAVKTPARYQDYDLYPIYTGIDVYPSLAGW
jgi:hypothetical protein